VSDSGKLPALVDILEPASPSGSARPPVEISIDTNVTKELCGENNNSNDICLKGAFSVKKIRIKDGSCDKEKGARELIEKLSAVIAMSIERSENKIILKRDVLEGGIKNVLRELCVPDWVINKIDNVIKETIEGDTVVCAMLSNSTSTSSDSTSDDKIKRILENIAECYGLLLNTLKNIWYEVIKNIRQNLKRQIIQFSRIFDTCYNKNKAKELFSTLAEACNKQCPQASQPHDATLSDKLSQKLCCMLAHALLSVAAFQASMYGGKEGFWKVQWYIDVMKYFAESSNAYFPMCAGNGDVVALLYLIVLLAKILMLINGSSIVNVKIERGLNCCNLIDICIKAECNYGQPSGNGGTSGS